MPSIFAALENAAFKELERVYGETFEFRPFTSAPGGGRREPDGTRDVRRVVGIHESKPFKSTEFGSEARGSIPAMLDREHLSFDIRQFLAEHLPKALDRFKRLDTREVFEVSSIDRDGEGRLKLTVKTLGFESA